eukprot:4236092-Amphidinium_carterae.3
MLTIPKQQPHKRELPSIFEGNKQEPSQGPTTTFKNWKAELQIYMSLEDHNIAQLMDEVRQQTVPIVDEDYIEYELERQGLSLNDADMKKATELQRLLQAYAAQNAAILQRNDENDENENKVNDK